MTHNCQTILQPCLTPMHWGAREAVSVKAIHSRKRTDFCKPGSEPYVALNAIPQDGGTSSEIALIARYQREKISGALSTLFRHGYVRREKLHPPEVVVPCYKYWRVQ
jgi:hypothetical protein